MNIIYSNRGWYWHCACGICSRKSWPDSETASRMALAHTTRCATTTRGN